VFSPFDLFNKIQTDEGFIIAISGIHPTNRADNIGRRGLDAERDLRGITPAGTNLKKVLRYFLPYATSPKRPDDKRFQHLWRNRCICVILHPIHVTNIRNHMVINKLIDLDDEKKFIDDANQNFF